MDRRIALLCAICFCLLPAKAEDCHVRTKNEAVLRQADQYLEVRKATNTGGWDLDSWGPTTVPEVQPRWGFDWVPRAAEVDYLKAPIFNVTAIRAAEQQAAKLEGQGQMGLAKAIRTRIQAAMNTLYGKQLNSAEQACISTADALRKRAFDLEVSDALPFAERAYRGVLEIYQKEIGNTVKTANAFGDVARICARQGRTTEAMAMYQRAVQIYNQNLTKLDADSASVLEAYADLLSQRHEERASQNMYMMAKLARKRAYKV